MDAKVVLNAEKEAKRFLATVKDLKGRLAQGGSDYSTFAGCRETGAVRRSSMDLTRALAELRK